MSEYDDEQAEEISRAIRSARAARGAASPPPKAEPEAAGATGILERIKALISREKDAEGRTVGTSGREREKAVMRQVDADTGRMRDGQSTDKQNGY